MKKEIKVGQVWQGKDGSVVEIANIFELFVQTRAFNTTGESYNCLYKISGWHDKFEFVTDSKFDLLEKQDGLDNSQSDDTINDNKETKNENTMPKYSELQGLWKYKATGQVYQFQSMNREVMDIYLEPNIHAMLPGCVFLELRDIDTHEVIKVDSVDFFKHFKKVPESDELDTDLPVKHASLTASDICQQAIEIMKERGKTYDKSNGIERSMLKTVTAFNALTGHELTEEQGWQFMIILKLARSQQGEYKADNYLDGTAYFALAGECASVERKHDLC